MKPVVKTLFLFSLINFAMAENPPLRWGADLESGAPYAYKSPDDPNKIIGFEADLINALGDQLHRKVEFVQNNWEGLVEGLKRNDYDIVANGLEITPDREEVVNFSVPYYITAEVLSVRRTSENINSLADARGHKIGTLSGSLAERILREQNFEKEIVNYNEEVHIYNDLAFGRIDAVLLDEPIALYYSKPNKSLKTVGPYVGRMEYGIALRKEDQKLLQEINHGLSELKKNGTLRNILEKWGMWNELTAYEWKMDATPLHQAVAFDEYVKTAYADRSWSEKFKKYVSFLPLLAKGALMTLEISILSMILATFLGLFTAIARLYGPRPVSWLALCYIELIRGTPLLIQLYLIFYGLPHVGIKLDPFVAAVIGLGLNYGACEAENYRAGILSIPKAQMDASQALGMSRRQSLRHVILPQAIRVVIPPVTNDFIALLKDSSLVSVISMVELTTTYGQLASTYFDYLGIGLVTAAIYFLIGLPFVRLSRRFESQMNAQTKSSKRGIR